jgi:hypothetical protein
MRLRSLGSGRTIASLRSADYVEFKCGHCGRTGRLTTNQLMSLRVPYTLPIDDLVYYAVCKRCGRRSPKTRVWAMSRGF